MAFEVGVFAQLARGTDGHGAGGLDVRPGGGERAPHLAEDSLFAHHGRVEPGGDFRDAEECLGTAPAQGAWHWQAPEWTTSMRWQLAISACPGPWPAAAARIVAISGASREATGQPQTIKPAKSSNTDMIE